MLKTTIGANYTGHNVCKFSVWAPLAEKVQVEIISPDKRLINLKKEEYGYWKGTAENIRPGSQYYIVLNKEVRRPDPASQSQPEGVHQSSGVVDHSSFTWNDIHWKVISLEEMIIYELHVGTFTPAGTFDGVVSKLDYLIDLGINTIEIMPIAQFPGTRNWGYDGVYPFAAQNSYGGVEGLKNLVNSCHEKGIAVILDVVYNHMGPEGNYLSDFGPYFTKKYSTPWGQALNFDDKYSDHVRNFFLQNALMWLRDFHIDGLRLDAVHAIMDLGAKHFLKELRESADELEEMNNRKYYLIAESDLNDVKLIKPYEKGGYGLDGQWLDDFHHAVHTLATGEKEGYYEDYGKVDHLAKALKNSFVYNGIYSSYRKRTLGNDASAEPGHQFVVCTQNHDQVGNRMLGDRLAKLVSFEMLKLIAGTLFISPYTPMLFMGEEYGEKNSFLYFVSHTDPDLVEAVRTGRRKEFEAFQWKEEVPDPQAEETFNRSKLNWENKDEKLKILLDFYRHLIAQRKKGVFSAFTKELIDTEVDEVDKLLIIRSKEKTSGGTRGLCVLNYNQQDIDIQAPEPQVELEKILDSAEEHWNGPGTLAGNQVAHRENITVRAESITIYKTRSKNE